VNQNVLEKTIQNINTNSNSKIKIRIHPTFLRELETGKKVLRSSEEMYESLNNWLKTKAEQGIHISTNDFHKDNQMKGGHWKKVRHASFSNPRNRFVFFYEANQNNLFLLAAVKHKDYEGNHKKELSLASMLSKRLIALQESVETISQKTFVQFIREVRETLSFEQILQQELENPKDLSPEEKKKIQTKRSPAYVLNLRKNQKI